MLDRKNAIKVSSVRIIDRINQEIGPDLKNLSKCKNIVNEYAEKIEKIEEEVFVDNNDIQSRIKSALAHCRTIHGGIEIENVQIDRFDERIGRKIDEYGLVLKGVDKQLRKIHSLQQLIEYVKILKEIEDISNGLIACVTNKDDPKTVAFYLQLYEENCHGGSVIGRLANVNAPNLIAYANKMAIHWFNNLQEKFSKDFENALGLVKWPHINVSTDSLSGSSESLLKLVLAAEYLFLIKSPEETQDSYVNITSSVVCPPLSTPIKLLLKPFRQRFSYHFTGARQTNRLDKPEWFYTQILTWAKDNHLFVETYIQRAFNLTNSGETNIRLEFIRGLVQLSIEKLCMDIVDIAKDEHLFSHLIDETLSFEQELRDTLGYPNSLPSAMTVLTQAQYLTKWITIEERFMTDKMDEILQKGSPWESIDPNNLEELRIPKCADQFVRLLDAIRERYCGLPQPGHQLQFLNLQLELIESFRRRLVQLHNSSTDNVKTTHILNAINYLVLVLREWGENIHYLHLHAALFGVHAEDIHSIFDKLIDDFTNWQQRLLKELSSKSVDNIKAKSMKYRHDNWIAMPDQNIVEPFILSVTAGEMLQLMATILHNLESELSLNIFNIALRMIAHQLDDFFVDSMIMNTMFSAGGAAQFEFDMSRNLFALFGQYSRRPDLLFKKVHDACKLFLLKKGSALLLHETLKHDVHSTICRDALKEVGVTHISTLLALEFLERRNDVRPC